MCIRDREGGGPRTFGRADDTKFEHVLKLRLGCLELVRRQTPSTSEGGRASSLYMMAHRMLNRRGRRTWVQQRRKILLQDGEEGGGTRRRSNSRDTFKSRRN